MNARGLFHKDPPILHLVGVSSLHRSKPGMPRAWILLPRPKASQGERRDASGRMRICEISLPPVIPSMPKHTGHMVISVFPQNLGKSCPKMFHGHLTPEATKEVLVHIGRRFHP